MRINDDRKNGPSRTIIDRMRKIGAAAALTLALTAPLTPIRGGEAVDTQMIRLMSMKEQALEKGETEKYYETSIMQIFNELKNSRYNVATRNAENMVKEILENGDSRYNFFVYYIMGLFYTEKHNYTLAEESLTKALSQAKENMAGTDILISIYCRLAAVSIFKGEAKAMTWLNDAQRLALTPEQRCYIMAMKTIAYFNEGDNKAVIDCAEQYRSLLQRYPDKTDGKLRHIVNMKESLAMGDFTSAINEAKKESYDMTRYAMLVDIYDIMIDRSSALPFLDSLVTLNDSLKKNLRIRNIINIYNELKQSEITEESAKHFLFLLKLIFALITVLIICVLLIIVTRSRNIKRVKKINEELKKTGEEAEESDRQKTEFIKNMSHQLRTPLNIISGFSQVFTTPGLELPEADRRDMGERIRHNTAIISTIISELSDISLLSKRDTVYIDNACNLYNLLAQAVSGMGDGWTITDGESSIKDRRVMLNTSLSKDYTFNTNETYFVHMIGALLDNAMKFTTEGAILLDASLSADNTLLYIGVASQSPPIPAEERNHIFESFVKLDDFREGVGLGLTLARAIARKLGGDVFLDNNYTGGNRFVASVKI